MMPRDAILAHPLAQLMRDPLSQRSPIDEDQRRLVLQDQLRQPVVDRAPVLVRRQRLQRSVRGLDPQLQLPPMPAIKNLAGQCPPRLIQARQERCDLIHRPLRRRQSDPRRPTLRRVIKARQRQRQVRPPLVRHDRVNLIHDHRPHRAQNLARAPRRQHQVQRLRRRDQNLRRPLDNLLALGRCRIARAQPYPNLRNRDVPLRSQLLNLAQRLLQVALNVVRQRLQRRDIQNPHLIRQLAALVNALADQLIDPGQKRRQRLARPGRSRNQTVLPRPNRRPTYLLSLRSPRKPPQKPLTDDAVEAGKHAAVGAVLVHLLQNNRGQACQDWPSARCFVSPPAAAEARVSSTLWPVRSAEGSALYGSQSPLARFASTPPIVRRHPSLHA